MSGSDKRLTDIRDWIVMAGEYAGRPYRELLDAAGARGCPPYGEPDDLDELQRRLHGLAEGTQR